jgi:hypothetical protein
MRNQVIANRDTNQERGVIDSYVDSFAADLAARG